MDTEKAKRLGKRMEVSDIKGGAFSNVPSEIFGESKEVREAFLRALASGGGPGNGWDSRSFHHYSKLLSDPRNAE